MRVCCISDTHNNEIEVPECDLLIHAGDATMRGSKKELARFFHWFGDSPATHKVFVPGNHDRECERDPDSISRMAWTYGVRLLNCEAVDIEGVRVYGYPWQPRFFDWAFNADPHELSQRASEIPECDILVSHGPPYGIGDRVDRPGPREDPHVGDPYLLRRIREIKPKYVVYGHIHEGYGMYVSRDVGPHTHFLNVSTCTVRYRPTNKPVQFSI